MYETIIVPIDLLHAERAGDMMRAAHHLGGSNARVWLINAIQEMPAYVSAHVPGGVIETSRQAARSELERLAAEHKADADVTVRDGAAHKVILDLADETNADAIVIASHQPGLPDYLLGSTAARVVRHAKCSVLVLR